jgi:LCP family protein required for cell wall assembly
MLSVVAGAYAYWRAIDDLLERTTVQLDHGNGNVMNVLVVGLDSREGLTAPEDIVRFGPDEGHRLADTIFLLQILPSERRGVVLSFPRDLYVTVHAGDRRIRDKINTTYNRGPQAVIDTVSALTGVPINHYVEVNFGGFRTMVEAVGGVEVCNERGMYDRELNFTVPAGTMELDGNQALSYVRSRHLTPDGDFGRMRRQQQFLRAVVDKVGRPSVLANPLRVNTLAQAFARNVTVDPFFNLDDMVRLALDVRSIGPDQLVSHSVPGRPSSIEGDPIVIMDDAASELLFQALRNRVDPDTGRPWSEVPPAEELPSDEPLAEESLCV